MTNKPNSIMAVGISKQSRLGTDMIILHSFLLFYLGPYDFDLEKELIQFFFEINS